MAYYVVFPMGNQLVQIQNWLLQEPIITSSSVWKTNTIMEGSILITDTIERTEGKGDWVVKDLSTENAIKLHKFLVTNTGPVLPSPQLVDCFYTMTDMSPDWGVVFLPTHKQQVAK